MVENWVLFCIKMNGGFVVFKPFKNFKDHFKKVLKFLINEFKAVSVWELPFLLVIYGCFGAFG